MTCLLGLPWKRSRTSLMKILDEHDGLIVIKNHGCLSVNSCIDVKVSVTVKESDEQFLKSLLLQASSTNTWVTHNSFLQYIYICFSKNLKYVCYTGCCGEYDEFRRVG